MSKYKVSADPRGLAPSLSYKSEEYGMVLDVSYLRERVNE